MVSVQDRIRRLLAERGVARAHSWLDAQDAHTVALQRAIVAIPAPTFGESERARFVEDRMRGIGLVDVRTDAAGNVHGRYGVGDRAGVVVAAHLDTVFPAGTNCAVLTNGDGALTRIAAPGIGDNARGLTAMLRVAEACVACDVRTPSPLTFVATVGEEGEGDLRGARALFDQPGFRPAAFIALDGPGIERVVHRALGGRRLRATFRGPGGHSWAAFGIANAAHAVGLATAAIQELRLPASQRAVASVVRLGGGTALNTIPAAAWLELDLRAESDASLEDVHAAVTQACARAVESVNRRRASGSAPLTLELTPLGQRPSGATDEDHPLVQAALEATHALGFTTQLAAASTDANVAMARGVPAIALGAGGRGGDAHLPTEWYENTDGSAGIVRALLVALAAGE